MFFTRGGWVLLSLLQEAQVSCQPMYKGAPSMFQARAVLQIHLTEKMEEV